MRIRESGGVVVAEDVPGAHWLLGLLFAGVGGLFVVGPLGLFTDADRVRWWLRALMAAMGALAVGVGLWIIARAPRSRLAVDRAAGRVRLERWGLAGRSTSEWPLAQVAGVGLAEGRDDEGGAVFRVHLLLREARPVPVSSVWGHGREPTAALAERLAAALGTRVVRVHPYSPDP